MDWIFVIILAFPFLCVIYIIFFHDQLIKTKDFIRNKYVEKSRSNIVIVNRVLYKYNGDGKDIEIPNHVKKIEKGAFSSLKKIGTITLPFTIEKIEGNTFTHISEIHTLICNSNILNGHFFDPVFAPTPDPSYTDAKNGYYVILEPRVLEERCINYNSIRFLRLHSSLKFYKQKQFHFIFAAEKREFKLYFQAYSSAIDEYLNLINKNYSLIPNDIILQYRNINASWYELFKTTILINDELYLQSNSHLSKKDLFSPGSYYDIDGNKFEVVRIYESYAIEANYRGKLMKIYLDELEYLSHQLMNDEEFHRYRNITN